MTHLLDAAVRLSGLYWCTMAALCVAIVAGFVLLAARWGETDERELDERGRR